MLQDIFIRMIAPLFAPIMAQSRFFWLYLASAVAMGLTVFWLRQTKGQRSLTVAMERLFEKRVFLHPSALLDYRFALMNHLLFAAVLGLMLLSVNTTTGWIVEGLAALFGPSPGFTAGLGASMVLTLALFVVTDFANFLGHWLQHKVPLLWEFHKVHHSAEVLTPVTAIRMHPVSDILSTQFIACWIGLVNGSFLYIYQGPVAEVGVLGANALDFLYYTIGAYHLSHSHVWLLFPKGLRDVFISPALHMIHHSANPRHFDKNFAFSLTLWDRLFGTLYMPKDEEQHGLTLGVGAEQGDYKTVWQLYTTPLRKAARILGREASKPADEAASKA